MKEFICKIPSIEEMNKRWDYLIQDETVDKKTWDIWRKNAIYNYTVGNTIPYYGFLDGEIICEATAVINSNVSNNKEDLINDKTVYLSAFRTNKEYEAQGYFSKLYHYMIKDLKEKGYEQATLGVEPKEKRNKAIYDHYGFKKLIKIEKEIYPDGTTVNIQYYGKKL